jgi:hypothetical protein
MAQKLYEIDIGQVEDIFSSENAMMLTEDIPLKIYGFFLDAFYIAKKNGTLHMGAKRPLMEHIQITAWNQGSDAGMSGCVLTATWYGDDEWERIYDENAI